MSAFSYQQAAEDMAVHIQGILTQLEPGADGCHQDLSAEEVEKIWLFSEIFTKCGPAKVVFDDLKARAEALENYEKPNSTG